MDWKYVLTAKAYFKNMTYNNTCYLIVDISIIDIKQGTRKQFIPFSSHPFITRDIAMFVPTEISEEKAKDLIFNTLKKNAGNLLVKGPDLFDMFEKNRKKSIAFRMVFQSHDRTLSDEEVNSFMDELYKVVKTENWEVR